MRVSHYLSLLVSRLTGCELATRVTTCSTEGLVPKEDDVFDMPPDGFNIMESRQWKVTTNKKATFIIQGMEIEHALDEAGYYMAEHFPDEEIVGLNEVE